jgi:hypothetical protein
MQLHCSNYYDIFFPLWTNGVPTMSILPTTNIIYLFIFPMAPRRVHVVSKHMTEVNQNHFSLGKKKDLNLSGRARVKD